MFGPKYVGCHKRREALKKIFDQQVLDYTEANLPTNIATFFEDVLAALPESAKRCDVEALIEQVLDGWRNITIPAEVMAKSEEISRWRRL